jgi:hypothetical protein
MRPRITPALSFVFTPRINSEDGLRQKSLQITASPARDNVSLSFTNQRGDANTAALRHIDLDWRLKSDGSLYRNGAKTDLP